MKKQHIEPVSSFLGVLLILWLLATSFQGLSNFSFILILLSLICLVVNIISRKRFPRPRKISVFLLTISAQYTLAQDTEKIDSLYHEYTWYVNTINSETYSCGIFFIGDENPVCENLNRLEDYFLFFRKRSEVTIELYEEFLKIDKPSQKLILEADSTIRFHQKGIQLIDSVLFVFYKKCTL